MVAMATDKAAIRAATAADADAMADLLGQLGSPTEHQIEVTSAAHRARAHSFYERLGYEERPKRFIKRL